MPLFNPRCSPAGARVPTPVSQMRELRPLLEECCSECFTSADSGNLSQPPLSPFYRCHLAGWGLPWSRCRGAVKEAKEEPLEAPAAPAQLARSTAPSAGPGWARPSALPLCLGKAIFCSSRSPGGPLETVGLSPGSGLELGPAPRQRLQKQAGQHEDGGN